MEIRTKHVRAGFEAGFEGFKATEIGAKQYDKDWTSKRYKKKQARKNGPPQLLLVKSASFFLSELVAFRRIYGLESYSRRT
jgi:hypothetical protein